MAKERFSSHPHYRAFLSQKSHAKYRGIEWKLTFTQWLEWWGDDIYRRGTGSNCLQMQRHCDSGAYEIGNISKGRPKDNMRTAGSMRRKRLSDPAARELQSRLDALMGEESAESEDDDNDLSELGYVTMSAFIDRKLDTRKK